MRIASAIAGAALALVLASASATATATATAPAPARGAEVAAGDDRSLGLPSLQAPPPALAALGRQLFFDRRLSVNGTLSCAMCHLPEQGFTSNETRTPVGMEGATLRRNAPTLLNVALVRALFHDGRAASLEAQALQPLLHPQEMANPSLAALTKRIDAMPEYRPAFRAAFGDRHASPARVASALAAYERTLIAAGSPFDRWFYGGDAGAVDESVRRGFELFRKLGCDGCHLVGPHSATFSDDQFHDTGVQARSEAARAHGARVQLAPGLATQVSVETLRSIGQGDEPDLGRFEVTRQPQDLRAYRTPTLRNVALTAPYMHDGSFASLESVIDYYAAGSHPADPGQDPRLRGFTLADGDRSALIAFLRSLTSPTLPNDRHRH
ncbi:MAG: hypothetical protein KGN16_03105 [Burkholderiales bacterium]|nr:hypothetical protein [Burkholderiales bacterium]